MSSVFLSHNSKDKPWVRELAKRLSSDGVVVWLDEAELNIGDSLIERIAEGIEQMQFVAAVLSNNSISSTWVQKELSLSMSKEIHGKRVTVLPLLIEKCVLPASLSDKLYADFTNPENFESEYTKLLRAIGIKQSSPRAKAAKPVPPNTPPAASLPNLRIIGIVKEKTQQDREYGGLQHYYFQLSSTPPPGWKKHFDNARSFPRHSMWRKAWVSGDCVAVKCALDELERYHLRDLKEDVETANQAYAQEKNAQEARARYEQEQREKEEAKRNAALDKLKFD